METRERKIEFSQPAVYEIYVLGKLEISWSERLASMQISVDRDIENNTVYVLIGKIKDQAELNGILNTLYDLHLTLLSIKTL